MNIREYLTKHRLLTDGAMGTYYAAIKKQESVVSEWANLTEPELIEQIHMEYLSAGAMLIRTNTFAASRKVLGIDKAQQEKLVRAGCRIAGQAVEKHGKRTGKQCFIAGDLGPLRGFSDSGEEENILEEYRFLIDIFLEEGVDAILFETLSDTGCIRENTEYIRSRQPEMFCIAEFSLNKNGYANGGVRAERLLRQMSAIPELDAVGFNCGVGSAHMLTLLSSLSIPGNKYFCVSPNAGYPEQLQNRMVFMTNTTYFKNNMEKITSLGTAILGACCGSTPAYIRELAAFAEKLPPVELKKEEDSQVKSADGEEKGQPEDADSRQNREPVLQLERNGFLQKLERGQVITVELDPPYDTKDTKIIQAANRLKELGVDMITIADSPQGRSRMDSVLTAVKVKNITGMPVMPHLCCRDRNMISMRSTLLGAYANDIRNVLLVTGDPVPGEIRSNVTAVFDYNSMKLMSFVQEMNREHFAEEPLCYGGAVNQGRSNFEKELERVEKKMAAGASYFLTQPVYGEEDISRLRFLKERTGARLLAGIMPLVSYRNASFVRNELVGIHVPDDILQEYHPEMTREEGEEKGAEIACRMMKQMNFVDGFYFMLPFNRVSLMEKILGRAGRQE